MRSIIFNILYWVTSVFFVVTSVPLLLLPGRKILMWWILLYTRTMCFWMEKVGGIELRVEGKEKLPDGPCIIAAKHQSWGDGFFMFSQFYDLAFVVGDHLEKFPLIGGILRKMGAIVVDNCGGAHARGMLTSEIMAKAKEEGRRVLIYPEGHLSAIGEKHRYRKGVFHMYEQYDVPIVPVATNLGLRWSQKSKNITPGPATLEFLDPLMPGMDKAAFMAELEDRIETRSLAMLPKGLVSSIKQVEFVQDAKPEKPL